ncbi:hypothetical protein CPB97_001637 [Podila verticillata]|nr:hypothetical protein CPB97_001637 [Podila verticillata]
MSLRPSALHHAGAEHRVVGTIRHRAFSSFYHHTRAKPTLAATRPKKTASPSSSSSSAANSIHTPTHPHSRSRTQAELGASSSKHSLSARLWPWLVLTSTAPSPSPNVSERPVIHQSFLHHFVVLTYHRTDRAFTTTPTPTLLKSSSFQKQLQMLTLEEVETRLAQNQQSFRVVSSHCSDKQRKEHENLIIGCSIKQVVSNNPIEDDLSRHVVRTKDGSLDKVFFGVFDGHGG